MSDSKVYNPNFPSRPPHHGGFPPAPPPPPGHPLPIPPSGSVQYIGARYVPIFANPIEWSPELTYEPLIIVTYLGDTFTSRVPVPKGVLPTNEAYWAKTGQFNAQLAELSTKIDGWDEKIEENTENVNQAVNTANNALKLIEDATADYTEVKNLQEAQAEEIANLQTSVQANTSNIETNTENILSNTQNITALQSNVSSNSTNIETIKTNLTALESRVEQNETDIGDINNTIGDTTTAGTIKYAIKQLQDRDTSVNSQISALDTRITANASNIAVNSANIRIVEGNIDDLNNKTDTTNTKLAIVKVSVDNNTADITEAQTDISNLKATNASITAQISALSTDVSNNKKGVADNASDIAENASAIANNTAAITALQGQTADLTQIKADIAANTNNIATNTTNIETNSDAIVDLKNKDKAIDTAINGINESIGTISENYSTLTTEISTIRTQSDNATAEVERLSGIIGNKATETTEATGLLKEFADLKESVESGESVEALAGRVSANEANITANGEEIEQLQTTVGDATSGLVKQVNTNTSDIATLKQSTDSVPPELNNRITALETTVGNNTSGLVKDVTDNMGDIADLQGEVTTLKNDVLMKSGGTMLGSINMGRYRLYNAEFISVKSTDTDNRINLSNEGGYLKIAPSSSPSSNNLCPLGGIANPTSDYDAANKKYVDSVAIPSYVKLVDGQTLNVITLPRNFNGSVIGNPSTNNKFSGCQLNFTSNLAISNSLLIGCDFVTPLSTFVNCTFIGCIIRGSMQFQAVNSRFFNCIFTENSELAVNNSIFISCMILSTLKTYQIAHSNSYGGCFLTNNTKPSNLTVEKGWGNNKAWANIS